MNFSAIKQIVKERKKLPSGVPLSELYCYYSIKALYDDYLNNRKDNKTINAELETVRHAYEHTVEQTEGYELAIVHIGDTVKAHLTDDLTVTGKIHSVQFYGRDKVSVNIICGAGETYSVNPNSITYNKE